MKYYFTPECYLDSENREFYKNEEIIVIPNISATKKNTILYLCECHPNKMTYEMYYEKFPSKRELKDPENNLQSQINQIRAALKNAKYPTANFPDLIEMTRGEGYSINIIAKIENGDFKEAQSSLEFTREDLWDAGYHWYKQSINKQHRFYDLQDLDQQDRIIREQLRKSENNQAMIDQSKSLFELLLSETLDHKPRDFDIYFSENKDANTGTKTPLLDLLRHDDGDDFNRQNLFLIGEGGIGKTYALMWIMKNSYKNKTTKAYPGIPFSIFIELSKAPDYYCKAYGATITDVPTFIRRSIYRQLVERNSVDSSKDSTDYWNLSEKEAVDPVDHLLDYLEKESQNEETKSRPCLILLLDGLNEVSTATIAKNKPRPVREYITEEINHLMKTYPSIKFVLTSRTEYNGFSSETIVPHWLQGIDDDNILDYLTNPLYGVNLPLEQVDEIFKNKNLMMLLHVPIFLRMFAPLAKDQKHAENLTTRGSILRAFLQEKEKIIYTTLSRLYEMQRDRDTLLDDESRKHFLSEEMQHFILLFILPAIANEMEKNEAYQISLNSSHIRGITEILDDILPYTNTDGYSKNCTDTNICGDYGNYVFKYYASDIEYTPKKVADAYLDLMKENKEEIRDQIVDYCVSTLGILVSEGKAKPRYSFIHQHFRDYFSALYYVNQMKLAAYTFHDEEDEETARAFIKDLEDRFLPQIIRELIGEYLGENLNAPVHGEDGTFTYNVPKDESDRTLIKRVIDLYRGEKPENKPAHYGVLNLFNVIKDVRKDLSGSDFHNLDLRECSFSYVPLDTCEGANFTGSLINASTWFPKGHKDLINSVCFSHDGKWILSASSDRTCRIWDAKTGECLHVLTGHTDYVNSACFSHDDKWILSASRDHTCRIWDTKTGDCLLVLDGHTMNVISACFSHDDKWILSASSDNTCIIWNAESGDCLHMLEGHTDDVNSAYFSHDDKWILSASWDHTCRIWDAQTGECLHVLTGHTDDVKSACFSHDDKWILSASSDRTCRIWDAQTGECLHVLEGHTEAVDFACFSHDDKWILSSSFDHPCRIWDAKTGECLHILETHTDRFNSACFSHDDKWILSTSDDKTCRIWDVETGKCLQVLEGHTDRVISACCSHNDKWILSASWDHSCRIWDATTGDCVQVLEGHTKDVASARFSHNDKWILSSLRNHTCRICNPKTGKCLRVLEGHTDRVISACFSHNNKWILSASWDNTCRIWDTTTGNCLRVLEGHTDYVNSACFSHDDKWILSSSCSWDNTCRIWDVQTGECLHVLTDYTNPLVSPCFSHDDKWILSASIDTCRIWDVKTGECLHILKGHTSDITSACFSYNDKWILSSSWDRTCRIWDATTGECLHVLEGHTFIVTSACFSHDDKRILSSSWDHSCRIWNPKTGECLHVLTGHTDHVNSACFSHDDKWILSASEDDTCRIWDAMTGECLHILEGHTDRFISPCFSHDDKFIASISDNDICLWNASTGNRMRILHYRPSLKIKGVDFTGLDKSSALSNLQKEQFQCMGGIVATT